MAHGASGIVVRQIGSLFDGGSVSGLSDRQLLERFTARRDAAAESAFAALVARHGPMVLHVCRQLLGDHQHAEDAFQAVFLVLARRARSVRDPDRLSNWLYGVALRTARKARVRLARRRKNERDQARNGPAPGSGLPADQSAMAREQAEALHEEIDRLPGAFRLPVVLCYFEGLTLDEAAQRLRWPEGTVRSRLARARDKLRRGLTRRGIVLPTAALAATLSPRSASASLSSPLCNITTRAAIPFAAGQAAAGATSASAMALAQEVLRSMLIHKLKFIALTWLLLGAFAAGAGYWSHTFAMKGEPVKAPATQAPQPTARSEPRNEDQPRPATKPDPAAPGRMFVAGRVLDPSGQPAVSVPVDIIGRPRRPELGANARMAPYEVLGRGATDRDGRFHLEAPRTASSRFYDVIAISVAPGFGVGWAELNPDADQPGGDIRLRPEQIVRVRLVDVSGMPAADVEVRVQSLGQKTAKGTWTGVSHWDNSEPPEGLRAWPDPVKTDDQGRLALSEIGRDLAVVLTVRDRRFARQDLRLEAPTDKETTLALQPTTIIEGRALAADTGKPIPDATIIVQSVGKHGGWLTSRFRADDQGRFEVNPFPADRFRVRAFPSGGQPYLLSSVDFRWTKGAVKKTIEIQLPRGVAIQGKVTEEGTERPVGGASIQFFQRNRGGSMPDVASKEDGSFQAAIPPGEGSMLVLGPTLNYIPKEIGNATLFGRGRTGGPRIYPHDIIAYQVKAGEAPHEFIATLRPGKTVKGHVVGPKGQTVEQASILTRLDIEPMNLTWSKRPSLHVHDGRFELHGLDPEKAMPIYFLDADHQWGTAIQLSPKQAGGEVTVHLQPCGQARARFVGPDGKAVAKLDTMAYIELLVTPGAAHTWFVDRMKELEADASFMTNVDPKHYGGRQGPVTDSEGRITLPDLIPGALYRISDWSTRNDPNKGVQIRKDFTVKPGETLDLGDILIEKTRS